MIRIKHKRAYWTEVYGLKWYDRRTFTSLGFGEYNSFIAHIYSRNTFMDPYLPNNLKK